MPEGACALEIGPGLGALTVRLLKKAQCVAAYEIDAGLVRALGSILPDQDRFTLFHKDFLKSDLGKELGQVFADAEVYVAANLPYYITSPCIMQLMTATLNIKRITVMVQKEVAQRICSGPAAKTMARSARPSSISRVRNCCLPYPRRVFIRVRMFTRP